MAIYLTPKKVRDKETRELYEPGKEFEMTVKRAEELEKNIRKNKGYEKFALERVDEPEKRKQNDTEGE